MKERERVEREVREMASNDVEGQRRRERARAEKEEEGISPFESKSGKSKDTDSRAGSLVSPIDDIFISKSAPGMSPIYDFLRASSESYNAVIS